MATPTVNVTLDKATYAPGDLIKATATYGDADSRTFTVTVTVTDAEGHQGTSTSQVVVLDPLTVQASDNDGHTWTKVSDDGATAVFTTTA